MSWIQENKFVAALAGGTLVGSAALLYLAMQAGGQLEEVSENLESAKQKLHSLQKAKPFPDENNLDARKEGVESYVKKATELRDHYAAYRPEELSTQKPAELQKALNEYRSALFEIYEQAGVEVPESCFFGFEEYASNMAPQELVGMLDYRRQAYQWLFTELAKAEPVALDNVISASLKEVKVAEPEPTKARQRGRRSKGRAARATAKANTTPAVYKSLPLELSFTGDEKALKALVESLANSKEYCFAVRALRIQNEKTVVPNASDVRFEVEDEEAGGGFDGGGFFPAEGEEEVVEETGPSDERKLLPLLGSEKIKVYLKLDLLLMEDADKIELPKVKKAN